MILIDVQGLQTASRFRGIGRYVRGLVHGLIEIYGSRIQLICNGCSANRVREIIEEFKEIPIENIHVVYPSGDLEYGRDNFDENRKITRCIYSSLVNKLNPKILLVTSFFEGVQSFCPDIDGVRGNIKKCVVIYDFIPYERPDFYLKNDIIKREYLRSFESLSKADVIFAISDYVKKTTEKYFRKPVYNISSASDLKVEKKDKEQYRSRDFIFYAGGNDERKNIYKLIDAYNLLDETTKEKYNLVIAGGGNASNYEKLLKYINNENKRFIKILPRLSDSELKKNYSNAKLFVFPSLEEGFGLPVLEAMYCGTAVLCSNTTSLPEVIDYPLATFNPASVTDISEKLRYFLGDELAHKQLEDHCIKQSMKFSWQITANTCASIIDSLASTTSCQKIDNETNLITGLINNLVNLKLVNKKNINSISDAIDTTFYNNQRIFNTKCILDYICNTEERGKRDIWVLVDNILNCDAELVDNFSLFCHINKKQGDKQRVLYLMNEDHYLYKELKIEYGDKIIGINPYSPSKEFLNKITQVALIVDSFQAISKIRLHRSLKDSKVKSVYSQHGINYFKPGFHGCSEISDERYDGVVLSSEIENQIYNSYYNFSDSQIIKSGLARWDLIGDKCEKLIFLYFTGRAYFANPKNKIEDSEYFKNISLLLCSPLLSDIRKRGYKLLIAFHHSIHTKKLPKVINGVRIIDDAEISDVKSRAEILVTDYSAMCFDFFLKNKHVYFYIPDYLTDCLDTQGDFLSNQKLLIEKIRNLQSTPYFNHEKLIEAIILGLHNKNKKKTDLKFYCVNNVRDDLYGKLQQFVNCISIPQCYIEYPKNKVFIGETWDLSEDFKVKVRGLSIKSKDGRYSDGNKSEFFFSCEESVNKLSFILNPVILYRDQPIPTTRVYVNDTFYKDIKVNYNTKVFIDISHIRRKENIKVSFEYNITTCPSWLNLNLDTRDLSVIFKEVQFL